jgi:hypothetical protein
LAKPCLLSEIFGETLLAVSKSESCALLIQNIGKPLYNAHLTAIIIVAEHASHRQKQFT